MFLLNTRLPATENSGPPDQVEPATSFRQLADCWQQSPAGFCQAIWKAKWRRQQQQQQSLQQLQQQQQQQLQQQQHCQPAML